MLKSQELRQEGTAAALRARVEVIDKYRFDEFELSPKRRILERAGRRISLTPKPLEILICLVERAGETVSKEQLFAEIWNGAAVEENNLTQYISALRKTLGEKRGENRYIVTDSGRGYRFVAPVAHISEPVPAEPANQIEPEELGPQQQPETFKLRSNARIWRYVVAVVLVLSGIGLAAWRWPTGTESSKARLAVLPFQDFGAQRDPAIADGFTDELTRRLTQGWRLPVVSRNSAFQFRGKEAEAPDVGRQLGVEYLVVGNFRAGANQFSAGARMIHCNDRAEVWRHEYVAGDLTSLEESVARDVAVQLRGLSVAGSAPGIHRPETSSPEAHELYLRGRYEWYQHTKDSVRRSQGLLERSTILDPNYALAYAALADTYGLIASWNLDPSKDYLPRAEAAASRSIALDPGSAEAYAALGLIENTRWEWIAAEENLRHALELNPGLAVAYQRLALNYTVRKRFDAALQLLQTAQTLDPLQTFIEYMLGELSFYRRQYDAVANHARRLSERQANAHAWNLLVRTYHVQGRIAELEKACAQFPKVASASIECASLHLDTSQKIELLDPGKFEGGLIARARAFAHLGNESAAIEDLEQAYAQRNPDLVSLAIDPEFDGLRSDPRCRSLLEHMGLVP
jgi:DNA-binding winged helix-turn-helix (wHTH) protein/TolB-like protein